LLLIVLGFLALSGSAWATEYYISPTASGSNNGTSCANAWAYTNSLVGSSQAANVTIHFCSGTYTASADGTIVTFTASGTSGNPVTMIADQGAVIFQAPYFNGSSGAISNSGSTSYDVLNGDGNLTIQNTANGSSLANQQQSVGMGFTNCTHCTIENTTVKNIYINAGSSSSATNTSGGNTACIVINGSSTSSVISGNTVSQCKTGIQLGTDSGGDASNAQITGNTISDMDWGINVGGGDSGDTINNLEIDHNSITNWTNWQYPTGAYHQDGIILFNVGNPSAGLSAIIHDNHIFGNLGTGSPTGFIYCADFTTCTIYNNLLDNTGNIIYGIMWLGQSSDLGKNMSVYNNTIIGATASDVCIMLNITGTASIENNVCTGPAGMFIYSTYLSTLADFLGVISVSNHNVWNVGAGNAWGSQASGNTASYATWQGDGKDANSSQATPNLNSGFIPQPTSSAIGEGANLYSTLSGDVLNTDYAGNSRGGSSCTPVAGTAGCWDAGALMYMGGGGGGGLATPTCSPGTETTNNTISVSCTVVSGATGCYTLSGTAPTAPTPGTCGGGSTTYSAAISVTSNSAHNLQILATESAQTNSSVQSYTYTFTVGPISCVPATETFTTSVTTSCNNPTVGALEYYTTDGSTPICASSPALTGLVTFTTTTTMKVIACQTGYNSSTVTNVYTLSGGGGGTLATPTCSPGTETANNSVSAACVFTSGETGCYRLDGTAPTAPTPGTCGSGSTAYSAPISITSNAANNLQILATESGFTNSAVQSYSYTFTVATPVPSPPAGTYTSTRSVTLSTGTTGAAIHYAIGSTPNCSSTLYSTAISVSSSETVESIGCLSGYNNSAVDSAAYVIGGGGSPSPAGLSLVVGGP
jgi:hypothetical protein